MAANIVKYGSPTAVTAISEIVEKLFAPRLIVFDVFVYRSQIIDELLSSIKTPVKVVNIENFKEKLEIDRSTILFFDKPEHFIAFSMNVDVMIESPRELHFFVYIEGLKREHLPGLVPRSLYPLMHKHLNFLFDFEDDDMIHLVTFTTFQQPDCRKFHPLTINQFSKATKQWDDPRRFSIERFRNFNGCELIIRHQRVLSLPSSALVHLEIEKSLNFKSIIVDIDLKHSREHDFIMALFSPRIIPALQRKGHKFSLTSHCLITDYVFIVSRFAPYSFFEKALLPFDPEVWYWLISFVAVGLLVIIVVSFMSRKVRNFVFGLRVRAPVLNLL
jgi:hypothetical protein